MQECDEDCVKWMTNAGNEIDHDRFKLVYREFKEIATRPEICRKAKRNDAIWGWKPTQLLNVVKDNIWPVRSMVDDLGTSNLMRAPDQDENLPQKLKQSLRRMWALVSVAYGCCGEVSLLCTLMDRLLEDLAGQSIGR